MSPRAVVLFSGGIDSTTTLAIAIHQGFEIFALTFDYHQRHRQELEAARQVLRQFPTVKGHLIFSLDLSSLGGSALTSPDIPVPKSRAIDESIPITYVPGRNLIFLSI